MQWLLVVTFRISLAYLTLHKSTIDIKEGPRDSTEKDSQFRHTETRRRTRRVVKQIWHQIEPRKLCHEFTSIIVWPLKEKDRLPVWFVFQFLKVTVKEAKWFEFIVKWRISLKKNRIMKSFCRQSTFRTGKVFEKMLNDYYRYNAATINPPNPW